jgi:antitoxin ParD1/3/4
MPTRNVVLTERQETLIEALVQSGRYQNASEVMREGLRLVENREVDEAMKLRALRAAAELGAAALDRGEFKEFADGSALVDHLNMVADKVLSGTEGN